VGINCVQGAALAGGSPVVAIDIGAGKLGLAREFGATAAVDASCEGLPGAALRHAPNGGFDHVIAAAGSAKAIEEALALVAPGGTLVVAGMPPDGDPVSFDAAALAHSARRILGCKMGGARLSEDVPRLMAHYAAGRLKLDELVSSSRPLEEINDAVALARESSGLRHVIEFGVS